MAKMFVLLTAVILSSLAITFADRTKYTLAVSTSSWNQFKMVHQWPQSECIRQQDQHPPVKCKVPSSVNYWTIHGLWPEDVESCNKTPFNMSEIQFLKPELDKWWPNIHTNTPADDLWKHEWDRHGTCAMSLPATGNMKLYFSKTLSLRAHTDISKILANCQIVPSDTKKYTSTAVRNCIKKYFSVEAHLEIIHNSKLNHKDLYQIAICMSKTFKPIDCTETTINSSNTDHIYYPTMRHWNRQSSGQDMTYSQTRH